MAHLVNYKNATVENESSFGASTGGLASRIRITSISLDKNVNKEIVEDTVASVRGRDRIVSTKTTVEGSIGGYGTPRNLHHAFELVNSNAGTSTALGTSSGVLITYNQNTSGTVLSKTVNVDRNNSQDKYSGVVASELSLKSSDSVMEWELNVMAKDRIAGVAISDNNIGETIKPFTFSDFTVKLAQGDTFTNPVTLQVSEWELTYKNGLELSHLSGDKSAARADLKIPTVEGKFKIFHEGSSWVAMAEGSTVGYLRIEGTLPTSGGMISGTSQFIVQIDVPKVELSTNVRPYEQNEFAVEEIEFIGVLNTGQSALWIPSITADNTIVS